MRRLLFIPVFVLFLSNVPFIQRIPLEKAVVIMQDNEICGEQNECSKNSENLEASCTREEAGCDQNDDGQTSVQDPSGDDCCQKTETTCVCICCFQFAAPIYGLPDFQFNCILSSNISPLFIVGHVKDPHIGAPWQPPDLVL